MDQDAAEKPQSDTPADQAAATEGAAEPKRRRRWPTVVSLAVVLTLFLSASWVMKYLVHDLWLARDRFAERACPAGPTAEEQAEAGEGGEPSPLADLGGATGKLARFMDWATMASHDFLMPRSAFKERGFHLFTIRVADRSEPLLRKWLSPGGSPGQAPADASGDKIKVYATAVLPAIGAVLPFLAHLWSLGALWWARRARWLYWLVLEFSLVYLVVWAVYVDRVFQVLIAANTDMEPWWPFIFR